MEFGLGLLGILINIGIPLVVVIAVFLLCKKIIRYIADFAIILILIATTLGAIKVAMMTRCHIAVAFLVLMPIAGILSLVISLPLLPFSKLFGYKN